ncbi:MAG TPA: ABC transporter permease [Steroidobacteraceae bacterium]|jgi:phospholipid/cholesterol/gamma-HCH transport system permease protein|nr:ABC transporter permease [Steroidobacteraceae bacterium]
MSGWELRQQEAEAVIVLSGDWLTRSQGPRAPELAHTCRRAAIARIAFDVNHLGRWDTTLVAFLWEVRRAAASTGAVLDDSALPDSARKLLGLLPLQRSEEPTRPRPPVRPLAWMGASTLSLLSEVGGSTTVVGESLRGGLRLLLGRARLRRADLLADLNDAGPRALAITGIVNFLIGAILAFVGAVELRRFAAESYTANLVGVAAVRELSSVVTAIVMAGRTGGAYAARIASMVGNDEIAALKVTGIPIGDFLLLPAVISLCIMMPFLYLFGCFCAIAGGMAVATASLGFTATQYLHQTFDAVPLSDFAIGALKSLTFAILIGAVGCSTGLRSARSAAAVGYAATSAVVLNIVGIIALDAVFAVIINTLGY